MKVSENTIKWVMRLYPPMLLQRIWVQKIHTGFRGADVKINRSLFTLNFGKSIFGGTIFSATDPFYALLFGQIMKHKGYNVTVWLKSASIRYLKPGRANLYYSIRITNEMIIEAETELINKGVFVKTYLIEVYSKNGELCAVADNEIYIRKK
jgi:acyl-coenzyme A thioesterase PaaI-like protein